MRKPDTPTDPANRRISLIVQYLEKKPAQEGDADEGAEGEKSAASGQGDKSAKEPQKSGNEKGVTVTEEKKE